MSEHKTPLLIALDGPVGAGKSSLADAVAKRLNILHLDTGAMYRALGLAALERGIDPGNEEGISALCSPDGVQVDVRFENGRQITLLDGRPIDHLIRTQQAGSAASAVSRFGAVRRHMVKLQQKIAQTQSMIIDGRDIGTVVLPDARVKVFLTASAAKRAHRRLQQIAGRESETTLEQVLAELEQRDKQDTQREIDPLRQAPDAALLDTTHLTFEQSVQAIIDIVEKAYGTTN